MARQNDRHSCGLHATAKALQLKNFVTEKRIGLAEGIGTRIDILNEYLKEDSVPYNIQHIYKNEFGGMPPQNIYTIKPVDDSGLSPILIGFRSTEESLPHMVAGLIEYDGTLIISDSLKDEDYVTTLYDFCQGICDLYEISMFYDNNTGDSIGWIKS